MFFHHTSRHFSTLRVFFNELCFKIKIKSCAPLFHSERSMALKPNFMAVIFTPFSLRMPTFNYRQYSMLGIKLYLVFTDLFVNYICLFPISSYPSLFSIS